MNILIVQQLAWASRVGHPIAKLLHARGDTLSALVYGVQVHRVVTTQRDVPYRHVYFADPLYDAGDERVDPEAVAALEARYGLDSVWRVINAERLLVCTFLNSRQLTYRKPHSNDYLLSVLVRTARLVQEMVATVAPAYVVTANVGSLPSYVLYLECRRLGIPVYSPAYTGLGTYSFIADDECRIGTQIRQAFEKLKDWPQRSERYAEAKELHRKFLAADPAVKPPYARGPRRRQRGARLALDLVTSTGLLPARLAKAAVTSRPVYAIDNIWLPNNSRLNAMRTVLVNYKERFVARDVQGACLTSLDQVDFRYVFYPLHVEPELVFAVWAPRFANQLETCRQVALSLPRGVRLLVKEHPGMVTSRQASFYDDLRGLPNVEVIHSSVPASAVVLHPRCAGVMVVSSTVGIEAAMHGRPVVLLGPTAYDVFPWTHRVTTLEGAIAALRAMCETPSRPEPDDVERYGVAYFAAVLEQSFRSDYHEAWNVGGVDPGAQTIVTAIDRRFQERA